MATAVRRTRAGTSGRGRRATPPLRTAVPEELPVPAGPSARTERRTQSPSRDGRSEEHTSELQSPFNLVCRLLLEEKREIAHDKGSGTINRVGTYHVIATAEARDLNGAGKDKLPLQILDKKDGCAQLQDDEIEPGL